MAQINVHKRASGKSSAEGTSERKTRALSARPWRHPLQLVREAVGLDPFQRMSPLRLLREGQASYAPDFDVKETESAFEFRADVPGIAPRDLEVEVSDRRLTVSGERRQDKTRRGESYYAYERSYGSFCRSFSLPDAADADHVSANLKDGVLTVTVAKPARAQTKQVEVKTS